MIFFNKILNLFDFRNSKTEIFKISEYSVNIFLHFLDFFVKNKKTGSFFNQFSNIKMNISK